MKIQRNIEKRLRRGESISKNSLLFPFIAPLVSVCVMV